MSAGLNLNRREFVATATAACAGVALLNTEALAVAAPAGVNRPTKDDISIAQWALNQELRAKKWTTLDFPRVAREDFDINGIEFVNSFFEKTDAEYVDRLRKEAEKHRVTMVLIMVDDEGETCDPDREVRIRTANNHHKWIDIAKALGCHSIRTNCRGSRNVDKVQALEWSADTYNRLLEYAAKQQIGVLIENHGGVSDDADWMVSLFERVNHPFFGSYPDWRSPGGTGKKRQGGAPGGTDNVEYLRKMLPYCAGMSYRNQPTEELTARMIKMCGDAGYHGFYGIESDGRDGIRMGKQLLEKHLLKKV